MRLKYELEAVHEMEEPKAKKKYHNEKFRRKILLILRELRAKLCQCLFREIA